MAERLKTHEIDIGEFYYPKDSKFDSNQIQFYKTMSEKLEYLYIVKGL